MTAEDLDEAIRGALDRAFAFAHLQQWPALAAHLATQDGATGEELRHVEAALLREYVVWREELLAHLRRANPPETIH